VHHVGFTILIHSYFCVLCSLLQRTNFSPLNTHCTTTYEFGPCPVSGLQSKRGVSEANKVTLYKVKSGVSNPCVKRHRLNICNSLIHIHICAIFRKHAQVWRGGPLAGITKKRYAYLILRVQKNGKRSLGRHSSRWKESVKMDHKGI
jgi:hypothetical protein